MPSPGGFKPLRVVKGVSASGEAGRQEWVGFQGESRNAWVDGTTTRFGKQAERLRSGAAGLRSSPDVTCNALFGGISTGSSLRAISTPMHSV